MKKNFDIFDLWSGNKQIKVEEISMIKMHCGYDYHR